MNKKRITKLIVGFILTLAFFAIPLKVSAVTFKVDYNIKKGTNGTELFRGRGIFGIYKAIYHSQNTGDSWLNAKSYYIGGDQDNNDSEWKGDAQDITVAELEGMNVPKSRNLTHAEYASCVGHQSQTTIDNNDKYVRAININLPNCFGPQYQERVQNGFNASDLDVLTLAVAAQKATEHAKSEYGKNVPKPYKETLNGFWRTSKQGFLVDSLSQSYSGSSDYDHAAEYGDAKLGEARQRASEIVSQKLETKSTDKDLIYTEYDENSNYTFIGPYKITTAGVNWDTLKAKITTSAGTTYDNISTFTLDKKTIYTLDGKVPNPDPYKSGTISSDSFYIAVSGKIDGAVKTIQLRRIYWSVRARVVAVFATAATGQNFIMYEGEPINQWIYLDLPAPKGVEMTIKKEDAVTGTELPGAIFVLQDVNTKEYIANTTGGSVQRVSTSDSTFSNVTKIASGKSIRVDKDGTYKFLEIQQQKMQSEAVRSWYEFATPEKPIEVGTVEIKDFKLANSTGDVTVSSGTNITIKNTKKYFHFNVYKTDKSTGKTLYNVKFVVKDKNTGEYVKFDNKSEAQYVKDINSATQFSIPQNKDHAEVNFLSKAGDYEIYEVKREGSSYEYASLDKPILVATQSNGKRGLLADIKIENTKIYRKVNIIKIEADQNTEVANMKLVIYDENEKGYFIEGDMASGPSITQDIKKASCYVTKKGGISVTNLKIGHKYSIYEVKSDPENGFEYADYEKTLKLPLNITGGSQNVYSFTLNETTDNKELEVKAINKRIYKNIKLIKKDTDSGKELEGVGLVLYDNTQKQYFVQGDTGKASSLTNDIKKATLYTTKKGGVDVNKLLKGNQYIIYEVKSNPENGYKYASYENPIQVTTINIAKNADPSRMEVTIQNQKIYRNAKITKIDTDSREEISGIGLVIYDSTARAYFVQGDTGKDSSTVSDINKATLYMTKKGGVDVNKLVIGHKYIAYEVISDPEAGYQETSKDKPLKVKEFTVTRTTENEVIQITIENQKKYRNIKIIKRDTDTNEEIAGFGLVLYDKTESKYFVQGATGKDSELTTDIRKATLYMTKKGGVEANKLIIGHQYIVYEVISDPDIGYEFTGYGEPYKPLNVKEFKVERDKQNARVEITVMNKKVYMNANIKKVDEDQRQKELNGIGFVLYDVENKKYVVSGAPCTFVDNIKNATIFKTQSGGIETKYLARHHSYIVYEVENSIYGYTDVSIDKPLKIGEFTLSGNDATLDYTATNLKITGNLIIEKKDKDNDKMTFEGVGFKLKNSDGKYIIALDENQKVQTKVNGKIYLGKMLTTTNPNGATEFITDSNSRVEIYNLLMGTYQVIETSIGDQFGYDVDADYVSWESSDSSGEGLTATVVVNRQKSQDTELNTANIQNGKYDKLVVKNRRKYIKISGFAWEDIANSKDNKTDDVWKENSEDKKLKDITVRLWSSKGILLASKETDSDGNYIFGNYDEDPKAIKIKINDIIGGYIEFEYNGMSYKTVPINSQFDMKQNEGNKSVINGIDNSATDKKQRDAFSSNYAIISNNKSHTSNGSEKYTLKYNYDEEMHESELIYGKNVKYGYEGQKYPSAGVDAQYLITAVTQTNSGNALCTQYNADDIRKNSVTEIAGVNLGIKLREQADLAVASDLNSVDIKINKGTETYVNTYSYAKRNLDDESDIDNFGMDVKFGINNNGESTYSARGLNMYTRRVYESDLVYANSDTSKELMKVYVTYRIRVKNQASTLNAKVAELVNYYDSRYTIEDSWLADSKGNKTTNAIWGASKYGNIAKMENGYTATYTNALANIELAPNEYQDIYIKFKLNTDAVRELLNKQTTLNNVSEISAFSTLKDNKIYAAIDKDSNPGSAEIARLNEPEKPEITTAKLHEHTYQIENKTLDTSTFEDDTDYAPALILGIEEAEPTRGLSGIVFEDANTISDNEHGDGTETHPTEERIGDGIYKQGEKGVENVKVELLNDDENKTQAKLYQIVVKNGAVTIESIPAEVETNSSGEYNFLGVLPGRYLIRYTYNNETKIDGKNIDVSEYKSTIITSNAMKQALNLKKEIDSNKDERRGDLNWILKYSDKNGQTKSKNKDKSDLIRYSDAVDDLSKREDEEANGIYFGNINKTNRDMIADTAYFDIGVEYTDVQDKGFNERVTFTDYKDEYNLENGKIVVIDNNGKIKLSDTFYAVNPYQDFGIIERPRQSYQINKRISYMKLTLSDGRIIINGNPYQQIPDNEVFEKWKELEFSAKGDSALPYTQALPSQVVVEIDNEIIQGAKLELEYTISLKNESEKDYEYRTNPSYYYYGTITPELQEIKTVVKKIVDYMDDDLIYDEANNSNLGWEIVYADELFDYRKEGLIDGKGKQLVSDDFKENIEKGYVISINTKVGDMNLNAGEVASIKLYGSKLLSSTSKEKGIGANNHVEIVETNRKLVGVTPGNYNPVKPKISETDDNYTSISVTPPTGQTDNITIIISILGASLMVLSGGVYLIKKKILK